MCQLAYDISWPACGHRRYDEQSIKPCTDAADCATKPDHFKEWLCKEEQGPCPDCQIRLRRDVRREHILQRAARLSRADLDRIKQAEKELDARILEAEENARKAADESRDAREAKKKQTTFEQNWT